MHRCVCVFVCACKQRTNSTNKSMYSLPVQSYFLQKEWKKKINIFSVSFSLCVVGSFGTPKTNTHTLTSAHTMRTELSRTNRVDAEHKIGPIPTRIGKSFVSRVDVCPKLVQIIDTLADAFVYDTVCRDIDGHGMHNNIILISYGIFLFVYLFVDFNVIVVNLTTHHRLR